jgi:hypothetical protein
LFPDLTTNDPDKLKQEETGGLTIDNSSAENHCTLFCIAESPIDSKEIWTGSDDGQIQLTLDAGKTWTNLTGNIPDLPDNTWVSHVEPSSHTSGTAYATFDGHKSGDPKPYVYKTDDFGKTWTSLITKDLPIYCHIIKEDLVNPELLFLGTEFGMYLSIDGGTQWVPFTGGLPKASIRDMVFQARENDLVIGTHGRGIYIIDDLTPIQGMKKELLNEDVVFLDARPTLLGYLGWSLEQQGDNDYAADNPESSPIITYYLKKRHMFGDMYLEIFDAEGNLITDLPAGKAKGINQIPWNMRMPAPKVPKSSQLLGGAFVGPNYPPGEYQVKLYKKEVVYEGRFTVKWDPNSNHSEEDRDFRYEKLIQSYHLLEKLAYIDMQILEIRDQAKVLASSAKGKIQSHLEQIANKMDEEHKSISATKYGRITGEVRMRDRIADVYSGIMSFQGRPTDTQISRLEDMEIKVGELEMEMESLKTNDIEKLNKKLEKSGLSPIILTVLEDFKKKK